MPVQNETIDGRNRVRISGALSIWEAAAVWGGIHPLLQAPGPLEIDLTAVESCDGAGIQILCQIQKALARRGEACRISGISDPVREAMRLSGLAADGLPAGRGEA